MVKGGIKGWYVMWRGGEGGGHPYGDTLSWDK